MATPAAMRTIFGGPDMRPRLLRDLLEERIDGVPRGGAIAWVTYYFRDEALARALVRACLRGVRVRLTLEGRPRLRHANDRVRALLAGPLGDGLRIITQVPPVHQHEKLYCFSHPHPAAFIGSYNPSGNLPEDPGVLAAIGDQDRGHNYLVEIADQGLAEALCARAETTGRSQVLAQIAGRDETTLAVPGTQVYGLPRRHSRVLLDRIAALGGGARLCVAVSHLSDPWAVVALCRAARRGAAVEIIAHGCPRRVPRWAERACLAAGAAFHRYRHPERLPMHSKFLLAREPGTRWAAFGSMNLTWSSRRLNREILAISDDRRLFGEFAERWQAICAEPATQPC